MAPAQIALPLDRRPTGPRPAPTAPPPVERTRLAEAPPTMDPAGSEFGVPSGIRRVTVLAVVTVALVAAAASALSTKVRAGWSCDP